MNLRDDIDDLTDRVQYLEDKIQELYKEGGSLLLVMGIAIIVLLFKTKVF